MTVSSLKTVSLNFLLLLSNFVGCWAILFWAMGRGYDITDDAHYLIWVSNPFIYSWSVSEFGFLWHPVYNLVGGDIRYFRLAGAISLELSAAAFGGALWRFAASRLSPSDGATLILAITTAGLWSYILWIPTPSYNELNLCGLLIFSAGLILATTPIGASVDECGNVIHTMAAGAISAFGASVVVFAKPTTALGLLALGLVWLLLLRPKYSCLFILVGIFFSSIFIMAFIVSIDGSLSGFIQRKVTGARMLAIHSPTHGLNAMWSGTIDPVIEIFTYPPQRFLVLVSFGVLFTWLNVVLWVRRRWLTNLLSLTIAVGLSIIEGIWRAGGALTQEYYCALLLPVLMLVAFSFGFVCKGWQSGHGRPLVMATLLAMMPLCYSFGSGNRVIYHASQAAVFWLSASIVLAANVSENCRKQALFGTTIFSSFLTVGMLIGALADPYRLPSPIWSQTEHVEIGPRSAPLLVDQLTAEYITQLQTAASSNGFKQGTAIIDLTGVSPGTVFALGGEAPGIPWLSAGYAGSTPYVRETLRQVSPAHLRNAWVLNSPGARDSLPDSILRSLGLNFPQDYQLVGHACMGSPCLEQFLWKPMIE